MRHSEEITPECFDVICNNFRELRRLDMRHLDKLTNVDGVKLNLLKQLEYLRISGTAGLTDLISSEDVSASSLKTLNVSGVMTGVALANYVARHPHLENLFINSRLLTDDTLICILGRKPHLRRLVLHYCPQLTDRSLRALGNLCPQLRWLCVELCPGMTDRGLSHLRETIPLAVCSSSFLDFSFLVRVYHPST